ncbi:ABC transporter permease [Aquabacter spiritensis]|uniref:NitT/TauT family transport system permease protein n=1 Tax=Aquabacter spiritensis TaxID=933073 RepID=A0A4R3M0L5_9HYPH|nr:ABC transporter permease [Aquabacter spiritensis]TCT04625.1 NitT/TauT family transport system permease protein [Aquabacter spiritensis]
MTETLASLPAPDGKAATRTPTITPAAKAARRRARTKWSDRMLMAAIFLAFLGAWEGLVRLFDVSPLMFAPPSEVYSAFVRGATRGLYWEHLGVTVFQMVCGLMIGASLGFGFGVAVSEFGRLGRLIFPYLVAIQSLPKVAVAPLVILWLGFGIESKVVLVALITFFPVLVNTLSGLAIVDAQRMDLMRIFRASRWQQFRFVRLPSAAPAIFAGLNVAVILALTGAIVAEFVGAQRGLGVLLLQAQTNLDTAGMLVILVMLAVIGMCANTAVRVIERRATYWVVRREDTP